MHAMSSAIRSSAFDHRSGSSFRTTDSASPGNNPLGNSPFGSCALSPCLPIHAQRLPFYAKLNPQIPNHPGNRCGASSQRSKKLPRKREKKQKRALSPTSSIENRTESISPQKYQQQEFLLSYKKNPRDIRIQMATNQKNRRSQSSEIYRHPLRPQRERARSPTDNGPNESVEKGTRKIKKQSKKAQKQKGYATPFSFLINKETLEERNQRGTRRNKRGRRRNRGVSNWRPGRSKP